MSSPKSVYDLNKEWRELIVQRLDKLDEGHKELSGVCQDIRLQLHKLLEIDGVKTLVASLGDKVRVLEDFKLKTITIIAVVQTLLFVGWAVVSKLFFK